MPEGMITAISTAVAEVNGLGYVGYALLSFALVLAVLGFVPVSPLCLGAGLAFGLPVLPIVLIALTAGSAAAALVSRYLLRARFAAGLIGRPRLRAVVEAIERDGWWVICLLRFSSPVHASVLCYAVGLTRISVWSLSSACLVGMAIPVAMLVSLGATGRTALEGSAFPVVQVGIVSVSVLITATAVFLVAKRTRDILRQQ
jgi:uncharacterized membrane protein YdjX (TVP38/TMEM64 family)